MDDDFSVVCIIPSNPKKGEGIVRFMHEYDEKDDKRVSGLVTAYKIAI